MDFLLRNWQGSDVESIAYHANNPKIACNLRDLFPYPYTLSDAKAYISMCIKADPSNQYLKAIEIEGKAVGSLGLYLQRDVFRKSAELGYWLAEPYWGHGIMTSAVSQLCEQAFVQYDIVRIFAEPFADNRASCRVLEKSGFILEGTLRKRIIKHGKMQDSCIYARIR